MNIGTPCCNSSMSSEEWEECLEEGDCSICGTALNKDGSIK